MIIQLCVTKEICEVVDDVDDEQIEQKCKMCASHFWGLTWPKEQKVDMMFVGLDTILTSYLQTVPCRFIRVIPVERNNWIMRSHLLTESALALSDIITSF